MAKRWRISLHPKLAAGLDLISGLIFWRWFATFGVGTGPFILLMWFSIRALWWGGLLQITYFPPTLKRLEQWLSLLIANLGFLFFLLFVDTPLAWYGVGVLMVLIPVANFWLVPEKTNALPALAKPHRRWQCMSAVFGVAGLWTGVEGMAAFQIVTGSTVIFTIAAAVVITSLTAYLGWRMYDLPLSPLFFGALCILGFFVAELAYAITLWPSGYLVNGFLITWLWYALWLLLRFVLSPEGVDWRRQRIFLVSNLGLLVIFLGFLIRFK